jgi:membrane protease YdiL (CAAX protease family)
VFQALHLAYGIYLPHYFLGGMILAWAFFRSGSLLVPIGLHAAWNLLVIAVETSRASGWISF